VKMGSVNARRTSWIDGMSDLFHRMMDSSDSVILEHTNKRKTKPGKQKAGYLKFTQVPRWWRI